MLPACPQSATVFGSGLLGVQTLDITAEHGLQVELGVKSLGSQSGRMGRGRGRGILGVISFLHVPTLRLVTSFCRPRQLLTQPFFSRAEAQSALQV